ncbi:MAG: TolC family outer membrane protein [Gammaproteobacteria bacterium]|nr:TolC family outer membrane protein [Gammaproteobacteria bacterium]
MPSRSMKVTKVALSAGLMMAASAVAAASSPMAVGLPDPMLTASPLLATPLAIQPRWPLHLAKAPTTVFPVQNHPAAPLQNLREAPPILVAPPKANTKSSTKKDQKKLKLVKQKKVFKRHKLQPPQFSIQTLAKVFQHVLLTNPNILTVLSQQRAARSAIGEARGAYLPNLDITLDGGKETSHAPGLTELSGQAPQSETLVVRQLVFDGTKTIDNIFARKAQYGQSRGLSLQQINATALKTTEVFLDVLRTKKLVHIARDNERSHIKTLKDIRERFAKGVGRRSEVSLARGRLARAQVSLYNTENAYHNAKVAYFRVVDQLPGYLRKPIVPRNLPKALRVAERYAIAHNPLIIAARKALIAADYQVGAAKGNLYPQISLQGTASHTSDHSAVVGRTTIIQGLVILNYNILRGGSDVSTIKKLVQTRFAAQHQLAESEREVLESVRRAWNNYQNSVKRLQGLKEHVLASEHVVRDYKEEFLIGQRSLLNLLDVENELFNSQREYTTGRYQVIFNAYNLFAGMGVLANHLHGHINLNRLERERG